MLQAQKGRDPHPQWCCWASSFFGWCLLPSFSSFGWGCMSTLLCCVVLLGLLLLWVVRFFNSLLLLGLLLFSVELLFSSLLSGGAAWPSPPLGGVAFPISFLRGVAFLLLLGVALFFSLSSVGWYLPLALSAWGSGKSDLNPNATQEDQPDPKKRRSDHPTPRSKGKSQDQEGRATPTPSKKVNPNPSLLKCGSPLGLCCFPPVLLFRIALPFSLMVGVGQQPRWKAQPTPSPRRKGNPRTKEEAEVLCLQRTHGLRAVREFCAGAIEKLLPCLQHVTPSHRHLLLAACCGASGTWAPRRTLPREKQQACPLGASCESFCGQATGCAREWVVAPSEANP